MSNGERGMTNKDISETLLNYMQTLWPMDGWVRNKTYITDYILCPLIISTFPIINTLFLH